MGSHALGSAPGGTDVMTLRNGDIHNGTAAQERFELELAYGRVSIPHALMSQLHLGGDQQPDRLFTQLGDRFSGRLLHPEITMLRVLDPTLTVSVSDIADIAFTPRYRRRTSIQAPDVILTANGDAFSATVSSGEFLLKTDDGMHLLPHSDIHLIDILFIADEDEYRVRLITNGGTEYRGSPLSKSIRLTSRYGDPLNIPLAQVTGIAFNVNHGNEQPVTRFRSKLNPSNRLQDTMRDGTPGPELIALRGGSFTRGDASGDEDEKPPRRITLKPFAMSLYEVSFDEYDRFCAETGRTRPDDSGWGRGRRPVVNVSWHDAMAYSHWLSGKTGQRYRLPTDAEWEYAARGGTTSQFWWGDELLPGQANCEGCDSLWDGERSAPVGLFPANPFGLHDTAGNVFEWVADCWVGSYADSPSDGTAVEKNDCVSRVIRGGAWSFPVHEIRSANRWRDFSTRRSDDTGFRLVRELN